MTQLVSQQTSSYIRVRQRLRGHHQQWNGRRQRGTHDLHLRGASPIDGHSKPVQTEIPRQRGTGVDHLLDDEQMQPALAAPDDVGQWTDLGSSGVRAASEGEPNRNLLHTRQLEAEAL
jgi:hypothetical protein